MTILTILQLGLTLAIALFLRPHIALLVQLVYPGIVRQRFDFRPLPAHDAVQELLDEGYRYLGTRSERIFLLMHNEFLVFFHPDGRYVDVLRGSGAKMYMLSATPGGLFFLTRNYGFRSYTRGHYHSTRVDGELDVLAKEHRRVVAGHSLGEDLVTRGTPSERLELSRRWYSRFMRREILPFAALSLVLIALSAAMIYRLWSV